MPVVRRNRGRAEVAALLGIVLGAAGSLTFGSGLVIVPFLEKGLVQQTGWLNGREFLVAVAIGMLSPGPVVRIYRQKTGIVDLRTGLTGAALEPCLLAALPLPPEVTDAGPV